MSNIVSFDEFKKKNGTNLPTSKGSSQVVSFQDFRVRNNAQNFLKNSAQAKFYNYITQPKQVETAQDKRNTWFNTGAKGNILQKTAGTVGDIGLNVVKGIAGAGEKLGDLASYGVAGVADVLGAKDYAKNVRESAQVNLVGNALQPVTNQVNQYSLTGDKLDSIVQSVGESYAMSQVGGALGKTKAAEKLGLADKLNKEIHFGKLNINIPLMSVLTGASSGITEAYQKGGNNQQAFIKGLTSGLAEGISEGLFGVFGQGGSSFEQEVMYKATKKIENQLARRLTKLGITAAGEGAEEGISYAFNHVADNLQDIVNEAFGKEINKMGSKWDWNEFGENILSGAIAGGLSGGAELLGGGRGAAILESTQHQVENALNRALTDAEVATLAQETEKQLNNGKINIDQIVNRLQNPTVEDLVQQQGIKSDTTPQLDSGLQQQLQLPTQNFTVDTSGYSGTQLQTYQNAINSGLLNNDRNTHDFVDFVSKISKDKGIVFNFTNNQALQDRNINAQINGFIDNNGITLNVDSNMALEKVIGHEITHTLENMANEYNSLKNSFKQLLGAEYETRLSQIKELYSGIEGANYENELISDLAGEYLFTNEEFINRLSTQKPSLFRRIYEEIKYLWKMATGTEQEKQLARTMRIYEQAYRNAGKVSNYNVDSFAQNAQNAQETQTTPQETKPEIKKYPNLTEEEAKEYEFLDSLPFDLTGEDLQTYERLQRKMEGKPNIPTRKDIQFKDIARDYGKYKDLEGYNSELTKDAESLVPDRQGRRTKEQWLDVASFIGERFKGNDEQLKKYAIQSWLAERPNNKDRLNRQGKGYVKFTIEEWMNKIYESANRTKPITQYSLSHDNQGRELTKEQQEFFKDSKVRDNDGKLQPVYHMTNADFNKIDFNKNYQGVFWFASSKQDLQDGTVSAVGTRDKANSKIMELYANITNPAGWREYDNYGIGQLKEMGYDGVILKEDDGSFVGFVFNDSNQIKNVDNKKPTTNPDIRYSLSPQGEMVDNNTGKKVTLEASETPNGTLMVLHNLTEDKLNGVLDLGGFPSASLAVTNDVTSNKQYGGYAAIFDKDTINPEKDNRNKVYSRDAYTTRIPKVVNAINEKGLDQVAKNTGFESWDLKDRFKEKNIEEAVDSIKYDEKIIDKYLDSKNIKVEPIYKEFSGYAGLKGKYFQKFIQEHPEILNISKYDLGSYENYEKYYKAIHDLYVEDAVEDAKGKATRDQADSLLKDFPKYNQYSNFFVDSLQEAIESKGNKVLDEYATKDAKESKIDFNSNEYKNFVKNLISPMFGEKYVRNNKEYYTASGNPRTFNQKYVPYTLNNIVKIMNEKAGVGQEGGIFGGIGELSANASRVFNSLEEIKSNENKLSTANVEEYNKIRDELSNKLMNITHDAIGHLGDSDVDTYIYKERAVSGALANIARYYGKGNKLTEQKVINEFKKEYITINNKQAQDVISLINDLENIPRNYFEAKPQRVIYFDEVKGMLVPNNADDYTKQRLKENNINFVEYDPKVAGDYEEKMNQFDNLKFSLSQQNPNLPIGQFRGKNVRRDINAPTTQENALNVPLNRQKRVLNPTEISNLTPESANTTPILPTTRTLQGDKQSRFLNNLNQTEMLSQESKDLINNADIGQYRSVTNEESLRDASQKLSKGGKAETERWFRNDPKNVNATDIAEGFILLNQYQEIARNSNNAADKYQANQSMVEVAKKLRQIGTEAGQTLQAYSILSRMTPEGMVYYAQSELQDAYNEMVKNKSRQWIEQNRENFELKPEETQFILDTMNEVANMEDGYEKKVKLAEIQKLMTDKLPPAKGQKMKSWMRISMLFNPKTQVRNVAGNALIAPVNSFSDIFASYADKLISRKTGRRTTGVTNIKAMLDGFKKGAYQATTDYRKGINTRDIEGNRFEIGEGKSFNDKTLIGKALNNTEGLLNYVMDAGDRVFSEAAFENSLRNQLKLNNTNEITQDMIDIARQESLSRTWNDNNNYTQFVLNVRSMLNKVNFGTYGLGDVLIPFAKTPANLTKAIVDYSPVGFVNTLLKGQKLSRSLENGQYTPQLQHDFVQTLGKATAGTMLYVLGMALAKAGITSGESDDDKDTQNFLKNTLGISNYSIKIGNKSFTYDWAQPLAAPLSITANIANRKDKEQALGEAILSNLDTASSVLLEQSFMQGINEVLNGNGGIVDGLINQVLGLPARAIPTLSKQIVDLTDSTQRTSFEYGKPVQSAINAAKAKIPGLSKTLAPVVDTMGREVQRYGGKNNLFNVFLNPANVNTENISESAAEIYRVYKETGDKTIMPRVAPYYINQNGEKITLNSKQKAEYQTISGTIIDDNMKDLIDNQAYQNLSDTEKASIINDLVNYAYNKARKDVLNIDMSNTYNKINEFVNDGGTPAEYYTNKEEIDYAYANPSKYQTIRQIAPYYTYKNYDTSIKTVKDNYSTTNERKNAVINYVNGLELGIPQKAMLIRMNYSSFKQYDNLIIDYINSQDLTVEQKSDILKEIGFTIKNGVVYN